MKGSLKHSYSPPAVLHVYQRAIDKGVIFYTLEDRLVYYTVAACKAKKHKINVSAAAVMFTHIHQSVQAGSLDAVIEYLHDTDTSFAMMYNNRYNRAGRLFHKNPGISMKFSSKSKRSNFVYVFNNHVEKGLCRRAVEERWSFLSYALSGHPFSSELSRLQAGRKLRMALNLIDRRVAKLQNLSYSDLERVLPYLDSIEREQYVDYIICRYAWVDFSLAVSQFGSKEALIVATDSTSGGEYDFYEEYSRDSDVVYLKLIQFINAKGALREVYSGALSDRTDMAVEAAGKCGASLHQLKKFFHIT